jgi:glycosyltransferase involved in cell wall biosynthesis
MDVFVFPSETDAFGNVAQEAICSGVPAIVSDKGGPKFIIGDGTSGFIATQHDDYAKFALRLYDDRELLNKMKTAAREKALCHSWDSIFESVFINYKEAIRLEEISQKSKKKPNQSKMRKSRRLRPGQQWSVLPLHYFGIRSTR